MSYDAPVANNNIRMNAPGIFVSASDFLSNRPGGAQQCTNEYIATLREAGLQLHFCLHELDKRWSTRAMRRLWPSSYFRLIEPGLVEQIQEMVQKTNSRFVFLNQVQLASIGAQLRGSLQADCKIIMLSHGLESTDLLHALRVGRDFPLAFPRIVGEQLLGDTLLREASYRSSLDLVLCLSPFDVELEHWLGARRVEWLPRTIECDPLMWNPSGNRIGFLGTLDHTPNIEGLLLLLRNLSGQAIRMRVVGAPDRVGRQLKERFPFVDYLGALANDELRQEAATWNCFVNPIFFCYPRGCSTKLATAIGWQIPVVTTTPGRRGYEWSRGSLAIADSPNEFSNLCLKMMDRQIAHEARAKVVEVAQSSPTVAGVGRKLAFSLGID